jgi:hypothetical protein
VDPLCRRQSLLMATLGCLVELLSVHGRQMVCTAEALGVNKAVVGDVPCLLRFDVPALARLGDNPAGSAGQPQAEAVTVTMLHSAVTPVLPIGQDRSAPDHIAGRGLLVTVRVQSDSEGRLGA